MSSIVEQLIAEKIRSLPAENKQKVLDFVQTLESKPFLLELEKESNQNTGGKVENASTEKIKTGEKSLAKKSENKQLADREIEKEEKKSRLGYNGLTASEWALLSKNVVNEDDVFNEVWNNLSSPRNKYQLEHGAVYPIKLAERLVKMYSAENDTVLDPFLGIGSTLIAAHNLNRHGVGIELNPKFAKITQEWLDESQGLFRNDLHYKIINADCRDLLQHVRKEKIQLTVTSPPYADFIHKSVEDRKKTHKTSVIKLENNSRVKPYSDSKSDFGNLSYKEFLEQIKDVLKANLEVTKHGGYSAWVVKDYRDTKNKIPYVPFHSDLARVGMSSSLECQDYLYLEK